MSKYNKVLILLFAIFVAVSIFMVYERYVARQDFEVYYSEDGIPENLE